MGQLCYRNEETKQEAGIGMDKQSGLPDINTMTHLDTRLWRRNKRKQTHHIINGDNLL